MVATRRRQALGGYNKLIGGAIGTTAKRWSCLCFAFLAYCAYRPI